MIDPNLLCTSCLNPKPNNNPLCPHCGFDEQVYQPPLHHLPLKTILGAKYLVGKAIGEGGFGITYIGYDLTLDLSVKGLEPKRFCAQNQRQLAALPALPVAAATKSTVKSTIYPLILAQNCFAPLFRLFKIIVLAKN